MGQYLREHCVYAKTEISTLLTSICQTYLNDQRKLNYIEFIKITHHFPIKVNSPMNTLCALKKTQSMVYN